MKKLLTIITITSILLLSGCEEKENITKDVEKDRSNPNPAATKELKHADINRLYKESGLVYEKETKKPFTGIFVEHHDNGKIKIETNFKDGIKNGKEIIYYKNGNKKYEWEYEDGVAGNNLITYYDNGDIKFKDRFMFEKDTQKPYTGNHIEYYDNGNKKWETTYKNGKLDGKFTMYDQNGNIIEETTYKDGKKDGKDTWYYDNGNKMDEYEFKNGRLNGKYISYDRDGNIAHEGEFKDGEMIK